MGDLAPVQSSASPSSSADTYKPLSLMAIIGCGLSAAAALIFVFWAGWLVSLALTGFVVSWLAGLRIRRSDGTLAGAKVATTGMVLGLVVALTWFSVATTTFFVINAEATAFAERWLENLRDGQLGLAFLGSVPPGQRPANLTPDDLDPRILRARYPSPQGPAIDAFRSSPIPELILRCGKDVEWSRIGVESSELLLGNYYVTHRYRLRTPEIDSDIHVLTVSEVTDRPTGPRREWRVEPGRTTIVEGTGEPTAYGLALMEAKEEGVRALTSWTSLIGHARRDEAAAWLLPNSGGAGVFDTLYKSLRQGEPNPNGIVPLQGRPPLLLNGKQEGSSWRLLFRGVIEAGPREAEFEVAIVTEDFDNPLPVWRIAQLRFLGERKKQDPSEMMPRTPRLPQPPDKQDPP